MMGSGYGIIKTLFGSGFEFAQDSSKASYRR
jgi:hypothetical protein